MKKQCRFIVVVFIISTGLFGQEKSEQGKYCDGWEWEKYSLAMKVGYLWGVADGCGATVNLFTRYIAKHSLTKGFLEFIEFTKTDYYRIDIGGPTCAQVVEGIDELYKDYANKHIPIFAIGTLVVDRISGRIQQEEIESYLRELRGIKFLREDNPER